MELKQFSKFEPTETSQQQKDRQKRLTFIQELQSLVNYPVITTLPKIEQPKIDKHRHAFKNTVTDWLLNGLPSHHIVSFARLTKPNVISLLKKKVEMSKRFRMIWNCEMRKTTLEAGNVDMREPHFWSDNQTITQGSYFNDIYDLAIRQIMELVSKFQKEGSNWEFKSTLHVDILIDQYLPLKGGTHIELPKEIKDMNAMVNVKNKDQECLKLAVTSAIYPVNKSCHNPG